MHNRRLRKGEEGAVYATAEGVSERAEIRAVSMCQFTGARQQGKRLLGDLLHVLHILCPVHTFGLIFWHLSNFS